MAKKVATKKIAKSKSSGKKSGKATKKALGKKAKAAPRKTTSAGRAARGLTIGDVVPKLSLQATGAKTVSLAETNSKKVVLYFYPKDATPGCTLEGHEFTRLNEEFSKHGVEIYGVSRDSLASHEKFKQKECYSIDLISDDQGKLCDAFGVIKDKNMYGRIVKGIERSTFVIDESGKVIGEWRGVRAEGHAQAVLDWLKEKGV